MVKILFICHGNICRSVSAQYILEELLRRQGITGVVVDSAGTSREEIGNEIYPPMKAALLRMGVPIGNHRARQMGVADYKSYDLLIGMDRENLYNMKRLLGGDAQGKLHCLMEYSGHPGMEVADPWYTREFDACAAQIREGCQGLLEHMLRGSAGE